MTKATGKVRPGDRLNNGHEKQKKQAGIILVKQKHSFWDQTLDLKSVEKVQNQLS